MSGCRWAGRGEEGGGGVDIALPFKCIVNWIRASLIALRPATCATRVRFTRFRFRFRFRFISYTCILFLFISPSRLWFVSISFAITKSHFNCNSFLMRCDVWRVLCNWIPNGPHHHTRRIKCALSVVIAQLLPLLHSSLYYPFGFHFSFAHFLRVASSAHGRVHLSTTLA